MDSYIEMQKELTTVQKQINELIVERANLLTPIHKMIGSNAILPELFTNINSKKFSSSFNILKEEIELSGIPERQKQEFLTTISNIQQQVVANRNKQTTLEEQLVNLKEKTLQRRNFILDRIDEINEYTRVIDNLKETEEKITSTSNPKLIQAIQTVKYNSSLERNSLNRERKLIYERYKEEIDIVKEELKANKKEELKKKIAEETQRRKSADNLVKVIEEAVNKTEDLPSEDQKTNQNVEEMRKVPDVIAKEVTKEIAKEETKEQINQNIAQEDEAIKIYDAEYEVLENNPELENTVKKKGIKINLSIARLAAATTMAALMGKRIINKAEDLVEESSEIHTNFKNKFTTEEKVELAKLTSSVNQKAKQAQDKSDNYSETIMDLRKENKKLDKLLDKLDDKYDFYAQEEQNVKKR